LLLLLLLLLAGREVMSGDEEVDSFDDLDFEDDLEAVRLQVYKRDGRDRFSKDVLIYDLLIDFRLITYIQIGSLCLGL